MLVFDIETSPRPEPELRAIVPPFDPTRVKGLTAGEFDPANVKGIVDGPFDPATVKLGALKDQNKINDKLSQAKADHEAAAAASQQKIEQARAEFNAAKASNATILAEAEAAYWADVLDKAAISPVTGHVLAVGFYNSDSDKTAIMGADSPADEPQLLREFWKKYRACRSENRAQYGFNIHRFDLPFLTRRSWLLGVEVPNTLLTVGRYFDPIFIDLMVRWQCGGGWNEAISLNDLAKFFGVGGKPDGVSGADFARLWSEDRPAATEYLVNDLKMTAAVASRMGVV